MHFMDKVQFCDVKGFGTVFTHYILENVNVKSYPHRKTIINLIVVRCFSPILKQAVAMLP